MKEPSQAKVQAGKLRPLSEAETNLLVELLQKEQEAKTAYARASQTRLNCEVSLREALAEEILALSEVFKVKDPADQLIERLPNRLP